MSDGRAEILKADGLYHVYDSKAEDGNVVALRGLHVSVYEGEAVAAVSYTHLTLPTIYTV